MRISDQQIADLREYQINYAYQQLAQAQTVISTGKQISSPADDPIGTESAVRLQGQIAQNQAFTTTASDTLSWLQTTENGLSGVNDALIQARSLAVQGANDTLTLDQRQAIAGNVSHLLAQAVAAGNADYGGRYVLGGYQTEQPPFVLNTNGGNPSVTYQGDGGTMQREISPGQTMQFNMPGNVALPTVFSALSQLQVDLQSGSTAAISNDIQTIDQAHDGLLMAQATVGSNINRIQATDTTTQAIGTTLGNDLSQITDANMAQAAVEFNSRQATYQAALTAAAKVVEPSLLEFLK